MNWISKLWAAVRVYGIILFAKGGQNNHDARDDRCGLM
jgi:hypothetical protein